MALGERAVSWPDTDNMLFLKVATGIGSGIISSGQLQRGEYGTAGDVGHIAVNRAAGIACRRGNIGCLEAIAGRPAVARALRSARVDVPHDRRHGNCPSGKPARQPDHAPSGEGHRGSPEYVREPSKPLHYCDRRLHG